MTYILALLWALTIFCAAFTAHAQEATVALRGLVDEQGGRATLMVTGCPGDSEAECVLHDLRCSAEIPLTLYVAGKENTRTLIDGVSGLLAEGYGKTSMTAILSRGRAKVELPVSLITLEQNDMNGTWDILISTFEAQPFFDSLSGGSADGLAINITGREYKIFFAEQDAATIMAFKKACLALAAKR